MSVSSDFLLASLFLCVEMQNIQVVSNKAIIFFPFVFGCQF